MVNTVRAKQLLVVFKCRLPALLVPSDCEDSQMAALDRIWALQLLTLLFRPLVLSYRQTCVLQGTGTYAVD